ncbi:MAG: recombination-associated protein RdgC [Pseudomonadota bacterium]
MNILSSSVSITQYKVDGQLTNNPTDAIYNALNKHSIKEEGENLEINLGWTSFTSPYLPKFDEASFQVGPYYVFSLRIDKKVVSSKVIKKYSAIEESKRLKESGQQFVSRKERKEIQTHVKDTMILRVPSIPSVFDAVWDMENEKLWFLSNLKEANDEFVKLFYRSFGIKLTRMIPYNVALENSKLTAAQKDKFSKLTITNFME